MTDKGVGRQHCLGRTEMGMPLWDEQMQFMVRRGAGVESGAQKPDLGQTEIKTAVFPLDKFTKFSVLMTWESCTQT